MMSVVASQHQVLWGTKGTTETRERPQRPFLRPRLTGVRRWGRGWPEEAITLQEPQVSYSETSVLAQIEDLLEGIEQEAGIGIVRKGEVALYMYQFPELIEVVSRAVEAVQRHLSEARLSLELYRDPEIADEHLVLKVRCEKYDGSVLNRIEAAEGEYVDLLTGKRGWLQLTTDFVEP